MRGLRLGFSYGFHGLARIFWRVGMMRMALMAALKGRDIPAQGNALGNVQMND